MAKVNAKIEYGKLKKIVEAMSKNYSVKVGLLNGKGGEKVISENLDMAGLGAVHEFGARITVTPRMREFFRYKFGINLRKDTNEIVIPARSFLRAPIENGKEFRRNITKTLDKGTREALIEYFVQSGEMRSLATLVGNGARRTILEAFATGGFGEWASNSELTIKNKGSDRPLLDKSEMRNTIKFEVEEK